MVNGPTGLTGAHVVLPVGQGQSPEQEVVQIHPLQTEVPSAMVSILKCYHAALISALLVIIF